MIEKMVSVYLLCTLKYVAGLLLALLLKLGFLQAFVVSVAGGMSGVFMFGLFDRYFVKFYYWMFPKKAIAGTKVKFSRTRRFIAKVRHKYGLWGVALLTPLLLQVPVGTIIAMRLTRNFKKVSLYMFVSFCLTSLIVLSLSLLRKGN